MVEAVILSQRAKKLLSKETIFQQNISTVEEKTINALQNESQEVLRDRYYQIRILHGKDPRLRIDNNLQLVNATTAIEWVI